VEDFVSVHKQSNFREHALTHSPTGVTRFRGVCRSEAAAEVDAGATSGRHGVADAYMSARGCRLTHAPGLLLQSMRVTGLGQSLGVRSRPHPFTVPPSAIECQKARRVICTPCGDITHLGRSCWLEEGATNEGRGDERLIAVTLVKRLQNAS
jgi:hypothetical protein